MPVLTQGKVEKTPSFSVFFCVVDRQDDEVKYHRQWQFLRIYANIQAELVQGSGTMEEHYKKLYEITERENQSLTKIVETQKHMIANLTQENETLKSACAGLNAQLEKVVALCDEQQQLLDEIIRSEE